MLQMLKIVKAHTRKCFKERKSNLFAIIRTLLGVNQNFCTTFVTLKMKCSVGETYEC